MIWGPWSGVGMVSDLEGHLGRRGLGMIAPEEGRSRLGDELVPGRRGTSRSSWRATSAPSTEPEP